MTSALPPAGRGADAAVVGEGRRSRGRFVVAWVVGALATLAITGMCLTDTTPATVWVGYRIERDAERTLPGVWTAPDGDVVPRLIRGYDADHSEDVLFLLRTERSPWVERVRSVLGIDDAAADVYRATGRHVLRDGCRWVEFGAE